MVERITDPHKPVQVHGYGRIADGDVVRQPPRPVAPPTRREYLIASLAVAVVVLAVVLRAAVLT